ncbi:hypothetical protein HWV62_44169 [Athelia sp. TMB]|nr:hypothetical protein HWV62_44169 [Athelia sp. TMB]
MSPFVALHRALGDNFSLPPKRFLVTTFIPSAWVDDTLISERKVGLSGYLNKLLQSPEYLKSTLLTQFLDPTGRSRAFNLEDALPSTLSKGAVEDFGKDLKAETSQKFIAAGYYEDWATSPSPSAIDYDKFDVIFFAFATPSSSYGLSWDSGSTTMLKTLVSGAHKSGTKVVLSVDWEYPNDPGAGQAYSSSDSANFLLFLKSLRSKFGSSKIISAAVTQLPWLGSNGKPLTSISAYTDELTYVNIMNYDVNGSSSKPGPNAPLSNACDTSSQPTATAVAAFKQWTKAGAPANKLLLGLPIYGYVSKSKATKLSGSFKSPGVSDEEADVGKTVGQAHPRVREPIKDGKEGTEAGDLSSWYGQQIPFKSLVASGALKKNSSGTYGAANGYTRAWDQCSNTPFLYNVARETVVTYDDTTSLADKAAYARDVGMAGTTGILCRMPFVRAWEFSEGRPKGLASIIYAPQMVL